MPLVYDDEAKPKSGRLVFDDEKPGGFLQGIKEAGIRFMDCLLYTSPSPRD